MNEKVCKEHYKFDSYVDSARWMSYYYQIQEILRTIDEGKEHSDILIIGKGDGIVPCILRCVLSSKYNVETFDYDEGLSPDILGDIRKLDVLVKRTYDCVVCCEVLEHLPWEYFESIIRKIQKVCVGKVIISLPVCKHSFSLMLDIPKFHHKMINIIIPRFWIKKMPEGGEHFWEVGIWKRGRKEILRRLTKFFMIEKDYIVPENTYHWFIIMNQNNTKE